jgi:hypothetical protein
MVSRSVSFNLEFYFQIPGFADLSLNDQMKLLQASWTEVGKRTALRNRAEKKDSEKQDRKK